jgi:hypothetical protein
MAAVRAAVRAVQKAVAVVVRLGLLARQVVQRMDMEQEAAVVVVAIRPDHRPAVPAVPAAPQS